MSSQISICQGALRIIGSARITALDGSTEEAVQLSDAWDVTRDAELERHPWVFSLARTTLAASSVIPPFDYDYAYPVPSDSLRILDVAGYPNRFWTLGRNDDRKAILINGTGGQEINVRYVQKVTTVGDYPAAFAKVLSAALAVELCERITQNDGKIQVAAARYEQAIKDAYLTDAIEMPPQQQPEDEWILARGDGCGNSLEIACLNGVWT